VRRRLLELPAGTAEDGETPLETAKRELAEEAGLRGGEWRLAATFFSTPGFCDEVVHVYIAEGVVESEDAPEPEPEEDLEIVRIAVAEVDGTLAEIEDAKTLVGLLVYLRER
jgi:ADP-ribose pyrophosphatase